MGLTTLFSGFFQDRGRQLQSGLISCVLLALCALTPLWIGRLPPVYLLGGLGAVGLALIALQDMVIGLTLLILSGATVPFSLGTGTESSINLAMLIMGLLTAVWLVRMVLAKQVRLVPTGLNAPLLGFLVASMLSWIAGDLVVSRSITLPGNILLIHAGQFGIYLLLAAAFFLAANHQLGEGMLKVWAGFLILAGIFIVAYQAILVGGRQDVAYWTGMLYMWPFVLLLAQLLFNPDLSRGVKLLGWGVLVIWAYWAVQITITWKGGWVPAFLAFGMLLLLKSWRLFLVAMLILTLVFFAVGPEAVLEALLRSEDASADPVRWNLWLDVFRMGTRSFLFGTGLGNYRYYWLDPTFESLSYNYVNTYAFRHDNYTPPAHNMLADIFAQTGALGLFFLLWVLVAALRLGFRVRRLSISGFSRAHANGVLCGFLAAIVSSFFIADWLIPYVYNIGFNGFPQAAYSWLLLGTLVPLASWAKGKETDQ